MSRDFNYYIIKPANIGKTPFLANDFSVNKEGISFLYMVEPAPPNHLPYLKFSEPEPNPDMDTDYFDLDSVGVFSGRVKRKLEEIMPVKGYELVPAVIRDDKKVEYRDFWIANIYQEICCFDKEQSVYKEDSFSDRWNKIEKIVIDKEHLKDIPLKERLVFVSQESSGFQLYHESLIEMIKSLNPGGMKFIPVEEWHPGIDFDFMR